ncbi:amidohydrolase family protein [Phytohabitans kaempferiae]|uniref:Amidohydrolase family protein n=1 Tax=Phytohabitans kaempferiae TaxID=1620943 RepID=A0ABV6LYC8_9ACTN
MRFLDSHMHLWHLSVNKWYPALDPPEGSDDFGLGEMAGLRRDYLPADYRADVAGSGLDVDGVVHQSAVTAPGTSVAEARWLDEVAKKQGLVRAVIGTVDPDPASIAESVAEQARSPLFRGIRVLTGFAATDSATAALLAALEHGSHVFDVVIRPGEVDAWLPVLREHPQVPVVLANAGWPEGGEAEQRREWADGLAKLSRLDNVTCKISALPMTLHTLDAAALRPWIDTCVDTFGVDRAFFGSNFPVDSLFGPFAQLAEAYLAATESLGEDERAALFATNAERCYRV